MTVRVRLTVTMTARVRVLVGRGFQIHPARGILPDPTPSRNSTHCDNPNPDSRWASATS